MKKLTILLAAAASVMLAGCAKERIAAPSVAKTTVSVSIDNATRTTIGELTAGQRPIYWANGDQIAINGVASDALSGIEEGTVKADFTFQTTVSAPYKTLYPASYYKNATTVTLPEAGALTVPMAAEGLSLKALTGVLKITVKAKAADTVKIMSIEVSSTKAQLSGDFTINYANGTLTGIDASEAAKKVTFKKNRELTEGNPYELFIPVPAGTYDFSVKVLDGDGNYMVKSTTSDKTIVAGQISALTEFEYNHTGVADATIEITTAEQLVEFAMKSNAGEYEDKPWQIVKLMNDITFDETTSKALRDADGIGAPADSEKLRYEDHYFNGIFDGQGYKIKGYISQETVIGPSGNDSLIMRPIFNYTGSDSYIRNIVIDESCDLQIPKGGFGSLAYRVKGVVENITCNANITVNFVAGTSNIGGIVGRVYGGVVRNCTMNGNFVCASTEGSSKLWKIGGIAGTVEDGGSVENCTVNGQAQWGTGSSGQGPSLSQSFWFGGVVGHLMSGKIVDCKANTVMEGGKYKAHDIRGKAGAQNSYIGGIVGQVDADGIVSGCTNSQGFYIRTVGPASTEVTPGVRALIGGIAGENLGTVTNCTCSIPASSSLSANDGHYMLALGGVVGYNDGVITDCRSTAKLIGPTQYKTCMYCYIGGIVGWTRKNLSNLTHEGQIAAAPSAETWGAVTNVIRAHGGVVGYVEDEITLDNLTNKGMVNYKQTTKKSGAGAIVAGVVGYVNGPVTVSNCVNEGEVFNDLFNNFYGSIIESANTGGVVGVAFGTETESATIVNCVNKKELGCRRGLVGGICVWAKNVVISKCENYGGTSNATNRGTATENISAFLGGIVAKADAGTTISECKVENVKFAYKPTTAACTTGGIVGALIDGTARIIECTAKNVTIEPQVFDPSKAGTSEDSSVYGGIAGTSVADSWIHSCKFGVYYGYKGETPEQLAQWDICSDTNFDDDGNNEVIVE